MIKNYGFIEDDIKIEDTDYILGGLGDLPTEIIMPDGQWDKFLPVYEPQAEKYETFGCTVWGSQNQIETYIKAVFGYEPNYEERYNYNLIGINPPGARPNDAYQSIRNFGLLDAPKLPVPLTLEEFVTPRPVTEELKTEGKKWLEKYELKHEWVTGDMKPAIMNTLKFSPIAVSVTAWINEQDFYIDNEQPNTHWTLCYGYQDTPIGIALKIFDSYDHSTKLLHPNHRIAFAKRIYIKEAPKAKPLTSWQKWQQFLIGEWCKKSWQK